MDGPATQEAGPGSPRPRGTSPGSTARRLTFLICQTGVTGAPASCDCHKGLASRSTNWPGSQKLQVHFKHPENSPQNLDFKCFQRK